MPLCLSCQDPVARRSPEGVPMLWLGKTNLHLPKYWNRAQIMVNNKADRVTSAGHNKWWDRHSLLPGESMTHFGYKNQPWSVFLSLRRFNNLPVFAVTGGEGWLRPPLLTAMMLRVYSVYGIKEWISAGEELTLSSRKKSLLFWTLMM